MSVKSWAINMQRGRHSSACSCSGEIKQEMNTSGQRKMGEEMERKKMGFAL
uniref:Uncharacterized protein n=1 Tax=Anguilla anguilla TaxID=7936 RepID=A0A0E9PBN2_ANGAN